MHDRITFSCLTMIYIYLNKYSKNDIALNIKTRQRLVEICSRNFYLRKNSPLFGMKVKLVETNKYSHRNTLLRIYIYIYYSKFKQDCCIYIHP